MVILRVTYSYRCWFRVILIWVILVYIFRVEFNFNLTSIDFSWSSGNSASNGSISSAYTGAIFRGHLGPIFLCRIIITLIACTFICRFICGIIIALIYCTHFRSIFLCRIIITLIACTFIIMSISFGLHTDLDWFRVDLGHLGL